MSDQPLDFQGYGAARDERLTHIRDMIEIEAAQRDGAAFRMAIDIIEADAEMAKNMLVETNPSDWGSIAAYQAQVRAARLIGNFLKQIIGRGQAAEASLRHDSMIGQEDV